MNTTVRTKSITFTGSFEDGTNWAVLIAPQQGEDYIKAAQRTITDSRILSKIVNWLKA